MLGGEFNTTKSLVVPDDANAFYVEAPPKSIVNNLFYV